MGTTGSSEIACPSNCRFALHPKSQARWTLSKGDKELAAESFVERAKRCRGHSGSPGRAVAGGANSDTDGLWFSVLAWEVSCWIKSKARPAGPRTVISSPWNWAARQRMSSWPELEAPLLIHRVRTYSIKGSWNLGLNGGRWDDWRGKKSTNPSTRQTP